MNLSESHHPSTGVTQMKLELLAMPKLAKAESFDWTRWALLHGDAVPKVTVTVLVGGGSVQAEETSKRPSRLCGS